MTNKPQQILDLEKYWGIEIKEDCYKLNSDTAVRYLDLRSYQISDLGPFRELKELTELHLANNQISDLSPLRELKKLTNLDLATNQISDLSPLRELKKLTNLYLANNQISDLGPLRELKELTSLYLENNQISDLGPLPELKKLTYLYLATNQIRDLSPFQELKELTSLGLATNQISDLSPLQGLKELGDLYLSSNQISDLKPIAHLNQLQLGDFSMNNIQDGSPLVSLIKRGISVVYSEDFNFQSNQINLYGNPLDTPPVAVVKQGNEAILQWLENYEAEKRRGSRPLNEAKMVLIGEPESGKTSLMNYLLGKPFVVPATTEGFKIEQWAIEQDNTSYRINMWDFGGQEIQSTVHQFFLTQNTLYVVVLNARKDENPDKYLEQIKSYAPNSPVIIVLNCMDENAAAGIDEKRLRETYTNSAGQPVVQAVHKTSLLKGHGQNDPVYAGQLQGLEKSIVAALMQLPNIRAEVPVGYFEVKAYLESKFFKDVPYLTHDAYEQICAEKNLLKASYDALLGHLNDLGTVRYFDDLSTRHLHILNPEWLSDGVYRILVHPKTHALKGIISEANFGEILQKTSPQQFSYPRQHYKYLIEMLKRFYLGHFDETTQSIFIPKAFGKDYPDRFVPADYKTNAIHFFFKYETFIPAAFISSFIAQFFGSVKGELYWQNGMVIEKDFEGETQTALVEQTDLKNRIDIWVQGSQRRELFLEIRQVFNTFHQQRRGLVVDEMVGLDAARGTSVKYRALIAQKRKNIKYYNDDEGNGHDIDRLLGMFETPLATSQSIVNVYGPYYDMRGARNIRIINQQAHALSADWQAFKNEISEANQAQIQALISGLGQIEQAPTPEKAKGIWTQLRETIKNLPKIASEEAIKWTTKQGLDALTLKDRFAELYKKLLDFGEGIEAQDFIDLINSSNLS